MASENEKVSTKHILPDDIVLCILSKLPLKSLKRFSCVRKSWSNLLENPNFMTMFRNNFISKHRSYDTDTSLLLSQTVPIDWESPTLLYLLPSDKFENKVKLDWPPPFQDNDFDILMVGGHSVNGVICLYQTPYRAVLWNPATEEFKVIPSSPVESVPYVETVARPYGFGYDSLRDDYKVIREVHFFQDMFADVPDRYHLFVPERCHLFVPESLWEIYSLRSNSWKKLINVKMPSLDGFPDKQVYMDGVCHWWGESRTLSDQRIQTETLLVSFNLSNEACLTTPIPLNFEDSWVGRRCILVILNRSIAFIWNDRKTTTFHIMILGELGVKESWTKLFTVGPLPCLDSFDHGLQGPFGVGKKGDIFFVNEDGELARFDLRTQLIEEIGIKGHADCFQIAIYKESLRPIAGKGH